MIPRTVLLSACAVLPLTAAAAVAVPASDTAAAAVARDVHVEEIAAKREPVVANMMHRIRAVEESIENSVLVKLARESVPETLHRIRDEVSDLAKGKGGSGGSGGSGAPGGVRPPGAAGFALVVGVAAVAMAGMMS